MKNITLSLLFCCCAGVALAQAYDPLHDIIAQEKTAWLQRQKALQYRDLQNSADNRSDIKYCRMRWMVEPELRYISGSVMTAFAPLEQLNKLEFDLAQTLVMDSVLYHGQNLAYSRSGNIITIEFPAMLSAGVADSVTFYYQGIPPSSGFGSFELNVHNGVPVLWTLSEPYGAMEWWPCKQALNDKIDSVDIFITCPQEYRAASNGLLVSENTVNDWTTAHWKHRFPIAAYLVSITVTNFEVFTMVAEHPDGDTKLINYVYPESLEDAQLGVAENLKHFKLFNDLYGLYPFQKEKYGHAQFGWGGGMEHQTMSSVGGFSYELLSHELAHQWFGDMVTCASWADIWLNEGFATYSTGLCYEFISPQYWRPYKVHHIKKSTDLPAGSVYVDDTSTVNRVFSSNLTYSKGAMVLHMLRWVCGDDAFFSGVRAYLNDPAIRFGYATTAQLKAHLETASGLDLSGFFADWVYGQGFPQYTVNWQNQPDGKVNITLHQLSSHPSVGFYEMPVPIGLSNGTLDTTFVLAHTFSGQTFSVDPGFVPTQLTFDPDLRIVSRDNSVVSAHEALALPVTVAVAPNPVRTACNLVVESVEAADATLRLWSPEGRLLLEKAVQLVQGQQVIPVLTGPVEPGMYIVELGNASWQISRQVLVD